MCHYVLRYMIQMLCISSLYRMHMKLKTNIKVVNDLMFMASRLTIKRQSKILFYL